MTLIAEAKAKKVLEACRLHHLKLATVESCTGGLIIGSLTDIAGSSDVVECGFITYSNEAKNRLVGVPSDMIKTFADIAVSVTGVAGPGGGSAEKPVGLVHMAVALANKPTLHFEARFGDLGRENVRHATVERALDLVIEAINRV